MKEFTLSIDESILEQFMIFLKGFKPEEINLKPLNSINEYEFEFFRKEIEEFEKEDKSKLVSLEDFKSRINKEIGNSI